MRENPFCARRIRPGGLPFLFPPGQDAGTLVARLRESGWQGEILGPHGTGKSALLCSLIPAIEAAGQRTLLVELHDRQRRLPLDRIVPLFGTSSTGWLTYAKHCLFQAVAHGRQLQPFTTLVVDGYEQLGRYSRWRLGRLCRRRGWGLLVTAHASVGLPELFRTAPTPELAGEIVRRLLAGQACPFSAAEVAECFARRRGDLREMLFDLYDLYEQRRPSSGQNLT